ncbi:hypothetical protein TWF281_001500 [Arthrobotrys megalospora]
MFYDESQSPFHDRPISINRVIAVLKALPPQPEDRDFYNPFTEEEPESAEEILRRIRALNEPLLSPIPSAEYPPGPDDIYGIWGDEMDTSKDTELPHETPLTSEGSFEKQSLVHTDPVEKKGHAKPKKGSSPVLPRRVLKPRGTNTKFRNDASYRTQRTLRPTKETISSRVRKNRRP